MRELRDILSAVARPENAGRRMALATLMQTEGSTYRRPGAKMLVFEDGERLGALSGGCLEADVAQHTRAVIASGTPNLVRYNARNGFDVVMEMGCQGAVAIWIEPITPTCPHIAFLNRCRDEREAGLIATVFEVSEHTSYSLGDRLFLTANEPSATSVFSETIAPYAGRIFESGRARSQTVEVSGGEVEICFEPILLPISLLVCGSGGDTLPLIELASLLGWDVTVMDGRPDILSSEAFVNVSRRIVVKPDSLALADDLRPDSRTVAVVMSHNYEQDREFLRVLIGSPVPYLAMLGPKRRTERMLDELGLKDKLNSEQTQKLHAPAGLDLGAETAEEIALSILAEIQAVLAKSAGGSLRNRNGSIHLK